MINWLKNIIIGSPNTQYLQTIPSISTNTITKKSTTDHNASTKPATRVAKLIMVTANNNNKYYEMRENLDGTFTVNYGRVGSRGTTANYPIHLWDSKLREKVRKGYKDQTYLFAEQKQITEWEGVDNKTVLQLLTNLNSYANQSIRHNYHVTADQVTQKQVGTAQAILDQLVNQVGLTMNINEFNELLLELYQLIPRRMNDVKKHLIQENPQNSDDIKLVKEMLAEEQATLDVMRGQVDLNQQQKGTEQEKTNLLDALGLHIQLLEDQQAIKTIKQMMGKDAPKFRQAFQVTNLHTQNAFDRFTGKQKNQTTKLFWHGSRNENWFSIIKTGLVLRPANAVITGKMFGYGLYFADKCRKSLNYTSLYGSYWAKGRQNQAFLALYDVHIGNPLKIKKHKPWCYDLTETNLKKRGNSYDSLFAQGGADLINNEYIVYNQAQCTIKYLVELKS